jgi:ATP-dependent Clp protease ATP-binding subunit ClpA
MFDRFTDGARKALALSREEAQRLKHDYIGTEHILLGLLREGSGVAAGALGKDGVTLDAARNAIAARAPEGTAPLTMTTIPFDRRAKSSLEQAMEQALELRHKHIDTEHLLLSIFRDGENVATSALRDLGVRIDEARIAVLGDLIEEDSIELRDSGNSIRARLAFSPESQPFLCLLDHAGRERLLLKLDADGSPRLEMRDAEGKVVFQAP